MADNYLEKHYDDYLRRKAEWERKKRAGVVRPSRPAANQNPAVPPADSDCEKNG